MDHRNQPAHSSGAASGGLYPPRSYYATAPPTAPPTTQAGVLPSHMDQASQQQVSEDSELPQIPGLSPEMVRRLKKLGGSRYDGVAFGPGPKWPQVIQQLKKEFRDFPDLTPNMLGQKYNAYLRDLPAGKGSSTGAQGQPTAIPAAPAGASYRPGYGGHHGPAQLGLGRSYAPPSGGSYGGSNVQPAQSFGTEFALGGKPWAEPRLQAEIDDFILRRGMEVLAGWSSWEDVRLEYIDKFGEGFEVAQGHTKILMNRFSKLRTH